MCMLCQNMLLISSDSQPLLSRPSETDYDSINSCVFVEIFLLLNPALIGFCAFSSTMHQGVGLLDILFLRLTLRIVVILFNQHWIWASLLWLDRFWCDDDFMMPNMDGNITVKIVRNVSPTYRNKDIWQHRYWQTVRRLGRKSIWYPYIEGSADRLYCPI